jgi:chromosome segregation ATPase
MPDGVTESLRPSPNFRELIEAAAAAIREQMEERLADLDGQIAELFAERQELRRLLTAAQTAERSACDEAAGLHTWLDQLQARGRRARPRNKR